MCNILQNIVVGLNAQHPNYTETIFLLSDQVFVIFMTFIHDTNVG